MNLFKKNFLQHVFLTLPLTFSFGCSKNIAPSEYIGKWTCPTEESSFIEITPINDKAFYVSTHQGGKLEAYLDEEGILEVSGAFGWKMPIDAQTSELIAPSAFNGCNGRFKRK